MYTKHITLLAVLVMLLSGTAAVQASSVEYFYPGADGPRHIGLSPDGSYVWAACAGGSATKIDLTDFSVDMVVPVGYSPLEVAVNCSGEYAYVTNTVNGYYTTRVNTATGDTMKIAGGTDPGAIHVTQCCDMILITQQWSSFLQVLDPSGTEIGRIYGISTGGVDVVATPECQYAYVVGRATGPNPGTGIIKASLESLVPVDTIALYGIAADLTHDGTELWVAGEGFLGYDFVYIVSTIDDSVVDSIAVPNRSLDIEISCDGQLAFVTNMSEDLITVISVADRVVIDTIPLLDHPRGLMQSCVSGRLYVACTDANLIAEITLDSDSLLLPSVAATPCDDECLVQPVQVSASQDIGGMTIPLAIPEGMSVCSLSTYGLATEDWYFQNLQIKEDSGFVIIALDDTTEVIEPGVTTVANVYFYAPPLCQEDYCLAWDTTLIDDFSRQLKVTDPTGTIEINPGFDMARDSVCITGYIPGDVDGNGEGPDIADLVCLVNTMFNGDITCVCVAAAMNVNGIGLPDNADIADLVYIVNYMFNGGPAPICAGQGSVGKLVVDEAVNLSAAYDGHTTTIILNAPYDLLGVELELVGSGFGEPLSLVADGLELLSGRDGDHVKVGILDMEGAFAITAGASTLFTIDGEWEIVSAMAADRAFNSIQPSIGAKVESSVPTSFRLGQNFPNPFNPTTEISFDLPVSSDVRIEIYNTLGQRVATLIDEHLAAGHHTRVWDASAQASGVYFYRLTADEFAATKKMMLLK